MEKSALGEEQAAFLKRVLPNVDIFAPMTPEQIQQLVGYMRLQSYGYGETVFSQGDEGDAFFVVFRGTVAVEVKSGLFGLSTKTLARLSSGQCFGEMALLTREPRTATVVCAEPTQLLALGAMEFDIILSKNQDVAARVAAVAGQRGKK